MLCTGYSLLIGSQLPRPFCWTSALAVRFVGYACWNTVRRSKRCSARGRAAALRDTVHFVNDERVRRRGKVEACVEEGEEWLGGAPRR